MPPSAAADEKLSLADRETASDRSGEGVRGAIAPELLSRLSIAFFACFGALLSAAAIGDGRPTSASLLLTFLGAR